MITKEVTVYSASVPTLDDVYALLVKLPYRQMLQFADAIDANTESIVRRAEMEVDAYQEEQERKRAEREARAQAVPPGYPSPPPMPAALR